MRTSMTMGHRPSDSWVDVNGHAEVIPFTAAHLPPAQRHRQPGYYSRSIPYPSVSVNVQVKAGTMGVIELTVYATHHHWEVVFDAPVDIPFTPKMAKPVKCDGRVSAKGVWDYDCSAAGVLRFPTFQKEDSVTSHHFGVAVGKASFAVPDGPQPFVQLASESRYQGFDTGSEKFPDMVPKVGGQKIPGSGASAPAVTVTNGHLVAFITVVGATPPPSPPVPVPTFPLALVAVIPFGKEGQRSLDEAAQRIAMDWVQNVFASFPKLKQPIMDNQLPVFFTG